MSTLYPECDSSTLRALSSLSDLDLVQAFQSQPNQARYFIALYCRYGERIREQVETLLDPSISRLQVQFSLNWIWKQLHQRLQSLSLSSGFDLSSWIQLQLDDCLTRLTPSLNDEDNALPPSLPAPLDCYLHLGLDALPGDLRFILLLADRFGWTVNQISAQLRTEGYELSLDEITSALQEARTRLFQALPNDLRALYLTSKL